VGMTNRPEPRAGVETDLHAETAEEFMARLNPLHDLWSKDSSPTAWIYRGQANASWTLKATAIRSPDAFRPFSLDGDASNWSERTTMAKSLLQRFRTLLDRAGVVVPQPLPTVDGSDHHRTSSSTEPPYAAFPLMALAQHHGLPTLLLDWTRRAKHAAYFAAFDAAVASGPAPFLAVWALRSGHDRPAVEAKWIFHYHAPAATNPNLRAQEGLFTWVRPQPRVPETQDYFDPSIEEMVQLDGAATLRRLTLPTSEAPKLLRLLSYEGVDGARMFPGPDGVVRAMREMARWDRREPEGLFR